ncbi:MATE family efflux transporter [Treponema sp. OMZ 792]|uniref:MATE family efflux transporter n=1 Tax=unclassified Treponema TaxID=2638727 RepID=UPI0020A6026E|nr:MULTISPECIES: MATE family efflux transporter [unclassified Treponema]UTC74242.1 MATE family efflux transporter [Treponema sp. OMZ 792]UTC77476.1 MATE family efflux transporter [Treponema sp. OMZ 799]UTC80639.1 MATE family efflux transporter [Treponema sp. OMZ 798]
MNKKNLDLTEGVIWKTLIIFTLPILAGNFFQHLYTAADAVIVGKFTGKEGLAAIDSVFSLLKLPINLFGGLSAGAAIIISQLFGAKKTNELFDAIHTSIGLTLILGISLSIIGVLISPLLLFMMGVPQDIFDMTLSYVRIYFAGMGVSLFYNIGSGILRAMGNSKTPFYALIISSALNVILDLIFIGIFNWGIGGAALATVVSQLISAVIILFALTKKNGHCPLILKKIKIDRFSSINIARLGLPIGIQSAFFPIANMIIQATVNGTGTSNIAAWALCGKLDFLVWILLEAMTSSVATFVAQNYGAKKYDRIKEVVRLGLIMSSIIIGSVCVILYFWNLPLGKLFINSKDYEVLIITERLMHILAPFYTVFVFAEILSVAIHGTGETFKPMVITLLGVCASRIAWIFLFVPINPVVEMIVLAFPISWTLTSIIFTVYYFFYRKKIC